MPSVATLDDVLAIERVPLAERNIPASTYEMLRAGAAITPDAPALSFFADATLFKSATVWSHRELFRRITQAANMFRRLGILPRDAAIRPRTIRFRRGNPRLNSAGRRLAIRSSAST